MPQTYVNLQDAVLEHGFSAARYRTSAKKWLNEGNAYVIAQLDARTQLASQTINTTADDAVYALASNFMRLVSVRNTTDADPLVPLELREYDDLSASSGKPIYYTIIGANIELHPTPDAAYSLAVRYYKSPAELVGDADQPELADQYRHLLVSYALIRCFEREHDTEMSMYWRGVFERDLMKARGELQADTADDSFPRQVGAPWEDAPISPHEWV